MPTTPAIEERPPTVTAPVAAALLGICRVTVYGAIRSGQIYAVRLGRRYLVPVATIEHLLGHKLGPAAIAWAQVKAAKRRDQ